MYVRRLVRIQVDQKEDMLSFKNEIIVNWTSIMTMEIERSR